MSATCPENGKDSFLHEQDFILRSFDFHNPSSNLSFLNTNSRFPKHTFVGCYWFRLLPRSRNGLSVYNSLQYIEGRAFDHHRRIRYPTIRRSLTGFFYTLGLTVECIIRVYVILTLNFFSCCQERTSSNNGLSIFA